MKKVLAILLALTMVLTMAACGKKEEPVNNATENTTENTTVTDETYKVGLVCIGDESDRGYTYNFLRGKEAATEVLKNKGINVEWVVEYGKVSGAPVVDANQNLINAGCKLIFNNSYDHEFAIADMVVENPDVQFVGMTNENFAKDDLDNTSNAFAEIYKGRYLAGVVAGMKINELIDNGTITADKAIIGYVGAFDYAEVISGYTAYYLGAKSVCPSVTMKVKFVGSWSDPTLEGDAAKALIGEGAVMISQHADNTNAALEAQKAGVFHTGYNNDMSGADVAPKASLISTRIDWTNYFVTRIEKAYNGGKLDADYTGSFANGEVVLTTLNTAIAAPGTEEALAKAEAGLRDGSIKVYDTSTFTVKDAASIDANGFILDAYKTDADGHVTSCMAQDTNGDFVPDKNEAIINGEFCESYFQSAPYFQLHIDGITIVK